MKDLIDKAEKMGIREKLIIVGGGPRLTHQIALEGGFYAEFGGGSKTSEVASYIVDEMVRRKSKGK